MSMYGGVFCALSVDFDDAAQRDGLAASVLVAQRAALAKAKIATEDSELFGSEVRVTAKSLKDALATLAASGLELEKKNVARWEKDGKDIAIVTKGPLAQDATVATLFAWLKKRARQGDTFVALKETKKRTQLTAYLESFDEYQLLAEALLLTVSAASASGANARVGFWGDKELLDEAVYLGVLAERGSMSETRHVEPQNIRDEDVTAFVARFGLDFDAISEARASWLTTHEAKKTMLLRGGKAGFVRADGSWLVEPKYLELGTFQGERASFKNARWKWGYLDETGNEIIAAEFLEANDFVEGRARVKKEVSRVQLSEHAFQSTTKHGFIERSGAFVVPPTLAALSDLIDGRILVQQNGKYGYLDETGEDRIAATFDYAMPFSCGRALVCIGDRYAGGKWGFIDVEGAWVIEPRYQSASPMFRDHALVAENGVWGVVDRDGRATIAPQYPHAEWLKDGNLDVKTSTGHGVVTRDGAVIVPPTFHRIGERGEVYEAMHADLTRSLFARNGRPVGALRVADDGAASEGVVPVQLVAGGPWGYVDLDGSTVIAPRFSLAGPFGLGRAIARDERGLLVIDRAGVEIARPSLPANARAVSGFGASGLAWVDFGRLALVATDGRVVIGPHLARVWDLDTAAVWLQYASE